MPGHRENIEKHGDNRFVFKTNMHTSKLIIKI